MLYTIFVFSLGIYVGQEYPAVPSVKTCFIDILDYIKRYDTSKPNENKSSPLNLINFETIAQFFKKND